MPVGQRPQVDSLRERSPTGEVVRITRHLPLLRRTGPRRLAETRPNRLAIATGLADDDGFG
jgi:hypothetical protein